MPHDNKDVLVPYRIPGAAPTLSGECEVDEELLEEAVTSINRIYVAKGLETARALGKYLVETFFGGDIELFRGRGRAHATFRALATRTDLHVAHNTLWYSVAVLAQLRELPEAVAGALPLSHHKLLLPITDASTKVQLASEAVEQGLSSRAFAELVMRTRRSPAEQRSSRRAPQVARTVRQIGHAIDRAFARKIDGEELRFSGLARVRSIADEIDVQIQRLTELRSRLWSSVEAIESTAVDKLA